MPSAYSLPSVADDLMKETHMSSIDTYHAALCDLPAADWEPYLLAHSNLPGPRGNLELAQAVADQGMEAQFRGWASLGPDVAPENTPACFLAFCGVVGLGAVMARSACRGEAFRHELAVATDIPSEAELFVTADHAGNASPLQALRTLASDPRWRIREAVAMALQRWGDADMAGLLAEMADWAAGNPLEQRAAAAALCEPRLLKDPADAAAVLRILDGITASIPQLTDRKTDAFKTLRQGLGYCWSVAVAALPAEGKPLMEKWLVDPDPDVRWIMRENLKKNRLVRMDAAWVTRWRPADSGLV
jgi:hypothetical protein